MRTSTPDIHMVHVSILSFFGYYSVIFISNGAYYVLILPSLHTAVSVYLHQLTEFIQSLVKEGKGIVIHAVLSWIHTCMNQLL